MRAHNLKNMFRIGRGEFYLLVGMAIAAIAMDVLLNGMIARKYRNEQAISMALSLGTVRVRLEEKVNANFSLINGMAASFSAHPNMDAREFNSLARILLKKNNVLKNMAAAPDFVIQYMYPPENNEKALGLDYRKIPEQWPEALAARETGSMILAGPLNLVQGGRGMIARIPVFDDATGRFWGLVSAVIDFDALLRQSGFTNGQDRMRLALRKKNSGEILWGDPGVFEDKDGQILMDVAISSDLWEIGALPGREWAPLYPDPWLIHIPVFLLALLGLIVGIQQKRSSRKLIESENQLKAMSRASHDALVMIDAADTIIFWNPAAVTMFGYTEAELAGRKMHDVICLPEERDLAKKGLVTFKNTGTGPVVNSIMEMQAVRKNGEVFPVERSVSSFLLNGKWCAVGSIRDITVRKKNEEQLTEMATTDALTGLSNRRHFLALSEMELKKALRYKTSFSLMMFDIDRFKKINDTYGHEAGDKVIQAVAETVKREMRETDISGRIGGEEFAVTMPETDLSAASHAAERLRVAFMKIRVDTGDAVIRLTASIGVVRLDPDVTDITSLLKSADDCLYTAKREGRNRVVVSS